ncbi:OLC1v1037744C1 [Oldenlandia corymbosa var. corymbosa]|uniref:OLC1v1037744C1 n=1 Tax=Oldenlandia corymbosa var. corymbosa TaxID=529605 RepID=A0AAV1CZB7_OLDCO|nr:OLC1v1037744C1 [Oldenlandia corymbosa var. corymbosa]
MSSKFDFLNELDNSRGVGWNVRVRLLRVWTKMDFNDDNEVSMIESVLIDEKGNRAVAEIKKDLIYKFQDPMKEREYKRISHFAVLESCYQVDVAYKNNCKFDQIYSLRDTTLDTRTQAAEVPDGLFNKFPHEITLGKPTDRASNSLLMIEYFASTFGVQFLNLYERGDEGANFDHGVNFVVGGAIPLYQLRPYKLRVFYLTMKILRVGSQPKIFIFTSPPIVCSTCN